MNPENASAQKLFLHQWIAIAQQILPQRTTVNPYQKQFTHLTQNLELCDKLLLQNLVHTLTIINLDDRTCDNNKLHASITDNLTALRLLLPDHKITQKHINTLHQLSLRFGQKPFSFLQAALVDNCSKSTIKRRVNTLLLHNMLTKLPYSGKGPVYFTVNNQNQQESAFDQAFEEFTDFTGYVDTQSRT